MTSRESIEIYGKPVFFVAMVRYNRGSVPSEISDSMILPTFRLQMAFQGGQPSFQACIQNAFGTFHIKAIFFGYKRQIYGVYSVQFGQERAGIELFC